MAFSTSKPKQNNLTAHLDAIDKRQQPQLTTSACAALHRQVLGDSYQHSIPRFSIRCRIVAVQISSR